MKKVRHTNSGTCLKCEEIFNRYPGFNEYLKSWFNQLQLKVKEAHISDAGRGKKLQEEYFLKGTSKARYGQSAHNYNAAIDLFALELSGASWSRKWFEDKIYPEVSLVLDKLNWYGLPGSPFFELPHIELREWKELVKKGLLKLVE